MMETKTLELIALLDVIYSNISYHCNFIIVILSTSSEQLQCGPNQPFSSYLLQLNCRLFTLLTRQLLLSLMEKTIFKRLTIIY